MWMLTRDRFELAPDYIISHTLHTLLEGCDIEHLCSFLINCARDLSVIAIDKSGPHVIETTLKSLASHLQNNDTWSIVEDGLRKICESAGSYVQCLCKGVSLDSPEFHGTKSKYVLAKQLNFKAAKINQNIQQYVHQGFQELCKFLVFEILGKFSKKNITFWELSMRPSSSFTVGKCFSVSNTSLKEMIVSELVPMRTELSMIMHGPCILMKFDADGFTTQPEQWRSKLRPKETVLKDFYDTVGC